MSRLIKKDVLSSKLVDSTSFFKNERRYKFMDDTGRKITKIAREVSKFTVQMMKEEGIGAPRMREEQGLSIYQRW